MNELKFKKLDYAIKDAEGVETIEQLQYLKSISCDLYQGYHFCKPLSAKDFEEFYKAKN